LEDIENILGKFKRIERDKTSKDIFTFAEICVEFDLSKGKHENIPWTQVLDYENMTFRC